MKIKTQVAKLVQCIIENEISWDDIEMMMQHDPEFDENVNRIKDAFGMVEWKEHPLIPAIRCSTMGDIEISGTRYIPIEKDGSLKVVFRNQRKKYNAANMVLSCFEPCPNPKRYVVGFYDGDYRNLRINNLYWKLR